MHFCGDWRDNKQCMEISHIIISIMKSNYSLGKKVQ